MTVLPGNVNALKKKNEEEWGQIPNELVLEDIQ